jgi:Fe-S-cluster containining protein
MESLRGAFIEGPEFACRRCGQCCRRDPYYAVSLLDIGNISASLGMAPQAFFDRFCAVVSTPGGFLYSAILAPDGCPFLKNGLCSIHFVKPIGCWVFPEASLQPLKALKKCVTAIGTCGLLEMPDIDRPLKADLELLAARDVHFEETKKYFEEHDDFDEPSWREATDRLVGKLRDAREIEKRSAELRAKAEALIAASK